MGCSSTSVLIVNAEVDSMGGVVDGEVGISNKSSPHKAEIERVQTELKQECGIRDERKRELDFLENGGNPLEFKLGIVTSVSVHSTSITNQHPDQFVISEAKGSRAITASPHGDSVESSGRPGTTTWDPNSADNLVLFNADNEFSEGGRSLLRRSSIMQSEQSVLMDRDHKTQEHGDSVTFSIPRKAYKRRHRSRPNGDIARLSSTDANPTQGCRGTSLPSQHVSKDGEVLLSGADNQNIKSNQNLKPTLPSNDIPKTVEADGQNIELHVLKNFQSTEDPVEGVSVDTASDVVAAKNWLPDQLNKQSISVVADTPSQVYSNGAGAIQTEEMTSVAIKIQPSVVATKVEIKSDSCQMNGFSGKIGDDLMTDTHNNIVSHAIKLLDSESSCTQTSLSIDGKNDSDMCSRLKIFESNGNLKNLNLQDGTTILENDKRENETKDAEGVNNSNFVNKEWDSACQSKVDKDSLLLPKTELDQAESALNDKVKDQDINEGMEAPGPTQLEFGEKPSASLIDGSGRTKEALSDLRRQENFDVLKSDLPEVGFSKRVSTVLFEAQTSPGSDSKLTCKVDEDSILKEAQIIEAKRKRITELSVVTSSVEIYQKSHWDYVLEEMTWLANDFAQERSWKLAAASQISYQVAVTSRMRKQERRFGLDAKRIAHKLAKVVMEFWHSIELQAHETSKELEQHCQKNGAFPVRAYAVRFLKFDESNLLNSRAEVPLTPDRISDSGVLDLSWKDSLTEENLFYTIPPGAMDSYKRTIESHMAQYERTGSFVQEEVETSACDAAADIDSHYYGYDEDEGDTNIYSVPLTFEASKSSRYGQKRRKQLAQAYGARPYEVGSRMLPMPMENKLVVPQFPVLAKRQGSNINVSIPTKRMRTASRRVISPFGAGASGSFQVPNKTDGSSCDTNSFQDDQSTLRGGFVVPNNVEVESFGEFEKQLPVDSAEVSTKPKKKRKAKHLNTTYEHKWQVDSNCQNEQFQSHFQKRTEIHQLESNGNNGLLGQSMAKKPKLMRQSQDNSFDNIPSSAMSVPSPVGSQMSNMSNSNKFIKMLGGRDRGRKHKLLKTPSGQSVSGSTWSLFEDQALVVLAHDLGPNWELVSDAFNSALNFKYIFRKAQACKERHICLMDRSSGEGADSADDSGSSQPYPSTLPGIPKGSARQLFQRLQGPMEEETLKSHFEKIIMIGQKQHYRKTQNDNQDPKQFQRPHSSHAIALSQVCPNNPNGGPVLTPLDLCDVSTSGPDVLPHGYQGAHSSGSVQNQGSVTQMLPASGATAALQGSSNMMMGNNFSSSPGPLNTSARDPRYGFPRSGSLPADEHQRMHLYNQMITGRNIPQSGISAPGAAPGTERGARILSSGSSMGMMSAPNRNMPMSRSALQASSGNMHTGGQGSSTVRPREAINMLRPGLSQDPHRQIMASDLPTPGNSQGMSHFVGLNSSFSNQTTAPPVSSYPLHHPISPQQPQVLSPHFQGSANHASNTQQQAYAFRLAKERQLQNRFLQPQQFTASNSLISQPQLPTSSPMQNSPQVQPLTSSTPVSLSPLTSTPQQQQKHQMPPQGITRNAQPAGSGLSNQTVKPRPRQHLSSQANRQHSQQRQQLQAQTTAVKGIVRGNLMMHQNNQSDTSLPNGVSTNPLEKGETATNSLQSQGLFTGSPQNSVQQSRIYPNQGSSSSKHLQPTLQSDNSCQGHVPSVAPPALSPSHQPGSNNQAPPHQKLVNQNQPSLQRLAQHNRQINSDPSLLQQSRDTDADHHPTRSFTGEDARTALPQVSNSNSDAAQVVSPPSSHKWHASEKLVDTGAVNSPKSLVSIPSNSSESVVQLGQRPQTSLRHGNNAQWQQSQSPVPQPQQPPPHSQPQAQLLQEGSGNLHGRLTDARLE